MNLLRVDSSALSFGSHSRALTDRVVASFGPAATVTVRDLAWGVPQVDASWVLANYTPEEQRTPVQHDALRSSDLLIAEVEAADVLVIGVPVYNFGVPAALKAWVDLVCRARKTFQFTESGPVGLLTGKTAVLVYVSSGTPMGSALDHASTYMTLVLGFIGITDVRLVGAPMHLVQPESLAEAALRADRIGAEVLPPEEVRLM